MRRPLNDAWFAKVEQYTSHWQRKDDTTLLLFFRGVEGSDPNYWPMLEAFARPHHGFVIGATFDPMCGKTMVTVKEPLNVINERFEATCHGLEQVHGQDLATHIDQLKTTIEALKEYGTDTTEFARELQWCVAKQLRENERGFDLSVGE